jgi:hypothetical protein
MNRLGLDYVRRTVIERADIVRHALRAGFRKYGRGWLCGFHEDRNPSASIRRGYIRCFTCGAHWNVIDLEMEVSGCNFVTALRSLADEYHIPWPSRQLSRAEQDELTAQRQRDTADLESAELWRVALLPCIDGWLRDLKVALVAALGRGDDDLEVLGKRINSLTNLEAFLKHASRAELLKAFRNSRASTPALVAGLVAEGRADDQDARKATTVVIRLLEAASVGCLA